MCYLLFKELYLGITNISLVVFLIQDTPPLNTLTHTPKLSVLSWGCVFKLKYTFHVLFFFLKAIKKLIVNQNQWHVQVSDMELKYKGG